MKKIKVYFQKPIGIIDSSYYTFLREFSPKNVLYFPKKKKYGVLNNGKKFKMFFWIKRFIKIILRKTKFSIPNAYSSKNVKEYDLIHCIHCLSKNKSPWVADFEYVGQFWFGRNSNNFSKRAKKKARKYLSSEYCKKIMPWSKWAKKNILKEFPELEKKLEIVYPGIPSPNVKKRKKHSKKNIQILFIGRDFEIKGGRIVVRVLDILTKKHQNVKGLIISDTPKDILEKYKQNKKIKFCKLVSQEKLFNEIYPSSDIFLYPTFSDTLGFAILEAQSYGLPVIAQKTKSTHTINETIQDGKTGLVVNNLKTNGEGREFNQKIVEKFVEKCEKLIKNKKLLKKMSKSAEKEIKNGKFSIKERNKKLKKNI